MNDDVKSVLRVVGCLPTTLGSGLVLLGTFYWLMEWRFAGTFLFLGLVWGLMLAGLGLVIMSTARFWMSVLGAVAAASSALLIRLEARGPYFDDSYYWVYAGDEQKPKASPVFKGGPNDQPGQRPSARSFQVPAPTSSYAATCVRKRASRFTTGYGAASGTQRQTLGSLSKCEPRMQSTFWTHAGASGTH